MPFLAALIFTTICIAGSAAYFSIYGLAHTFSGAFWAVVFMGASLEMGKLVSASFLYRFWNKISKFLKVYLISAIVLLMVITSTGIYGYLSAGYATDTLDYKTVEVQLTSLNTEKNELMKRKEEIDKQISQLPPNYVAARQRLMKTFESELKHINDRLPAIAIDLQSLNSKRVMVQAHTGPIVFIAQSFGASIDDATKWIIIMLIIVFDPLAIALTIAANIMIQQRQIVQEPEKLENRIEPEIEPEASVSKPEPEVEQNEIIEQNLNPPITLPDKDETLEELKRRKTITENIRSGQIS
jgi:hypothetical protein